MRRHTSLHKSDRGGARPHMIPVSLFMLLALFLAACQPIMPPIETAPVAAHAPSAEVLNGQPQ